MMKKNGWRALRLIALSWLLVLNTFNSLSAQPPVIPLPAHYKLLDGCFRLEMPVGVIAPASADSKLTALAISCLNEAGYDAFAGDGRILAGQTLLIQLTESYDTSISDEGYHLHIGATQIMLKANTEAGIQYGLNTLGQLLRSAKDRCLPAWQITDYPRFSYRGMHLDVSRHFMPVEFIFRYIDLLAMHRMNYFHWHLVDDQGWRLQIDRYPLLTEIGAWREDRSHEHWNLRPLSKPDAPKSYGGYYAKAQVRQIVAYAAERNITVIPEIEMPAHVMSALAAYPELSCSGQNLGVPPGGVWPITHIYCAGKEETFEFLENVLLEVMELFPSPIIHIGGDEADKTEWQTCPLCRQRMADENLSDVHALQSYFIQHIGRFIERHGRRLMGWDEILEGGLAENAIVMSWRGEEGAIQAARMGHQAVMTPGSHCYFDHYQGDPATEPLAIGGFTPLDKVYAFEPVPAVLSPEEAGYILGAQANVWTEYIPNPDHVEYMALPRMAALAEVLWSPKSSRNWDSFVFRLPQTIRHYNKLQINYSQAAWNVKVLEEVDAPSRNLKLTLSSSLPVDSIIYKIQGESHASRREYYTGPVYLNKSAVLSAFAVVEGKHTAEINRSYTLHKAFGLPVNQRPVPSSRYAGNPFTLTDGIAGTRWFNDGRWVGILDDKWEAEVHFPEKLRIGQVGLIALYDPASWIFLPDSFTLEASRNGRTFKQAGNYHINSGTTDYSASEKYFSLPVKPGRYKAIRIQAGRTVAVPTAHPGFGKKVWMFFSEIIPE